MSDAQAEAERILLEHERLAKELMRGSGDPESFGRSHLALVAALAAAIEVSRDDPTASCDCDACSALREALSALRQTDGEDDSDGT